MSLPQCIEGCPQHETRVRHKQRHRSRTVSKEGRQSLLPHKTRSNKGFTTSMVVHSRFRGLWGGSVKSWMRGGVQGGAGGPAVSGGVQGVPGRGPGYPDILGKHEKTRKSLRRFQYPKWLRVPLFGACRGPPPPFPDLKVLGGGKGEVKPPKSTTRHPKVGGYLIGHTMGYGSIWPHFYG